MNPVEAAILAGVAAIFAFSIYSLFQAGSDFHPAALTAMAGNPISEGRSPASAAPSAFQNLDVACEEQPPTETAATKVRLTGKLCMTGARQARVVNQANQYSATVFTDAGNGKFSTDYIPLVAGANPIRVEFSGSETAAVTREFVVTKN
jgi:hypothetical protein